MKRFVHQQHISVVPVPILTTTGETLIQLGENGKFACLFRYIDGVSPTEEEVSYLESFGEATGILSEVLSVIDPGLTPVYRHIMNYGRPIRYAV